LELKISWIRVKFNRLLAITLLACLACVSYSSAARMRVGRITIKGNIKLDSENIRHKMLTKEGDPFDPAKIRKDIEIIYNTGYFKDIKVDSENVEGKLSLTFILVERPSVRQIVIDGNLEIEESDIRDVVTVTTGNIYSEKETKKTIQNIKNLYQDAGFYMASIKAVPIRVSNKWIKLKLEIKENKEVLIQNIVFKGNKDFTDGDLKSVIETSEEWLFSWLTDAGKLKKEAIDKDVSRLMVFYLDRGYIDVEVGNPDIKLDKEGLIVTIPISEGNKFTVGRVNFVGNRIFPEDSLKKKVVMENGDVFSKEKLRETIDGINEMYSGEGYLNTVVYPDMKERNKEKHIVNIVLRINEGKIVHLNEIIIKGNTRTRDKVIRRQVPIGEGGILSQKVITETKGNLKRLGFFKTVDIVPAPSKSGIQDEVDLNIKIEERMTGTFSLGAGWSNINQLMGTFSVSESNFMGTGRKVSVSATLGGNIQQYNIGLKDPYFMDTFFFAGFNSFFNRQSSTSFRTYNRDRKGGDITIGYPLIDKATNNRYTRLFATYKYVDINIFDVLPDVSDYVKNRVGKSTTSSVTLAIQRDSRNDFFAPTKGTFSRFSIENAGGVMGGSNNFTKVILSSGWHFPLGFWNFTFHTRVGGGYLLPMGDRKLEDISFDVPFRLGGNNNVRGFKWGELGPRDKNTAVGGDQYLFFNFELGFPIFGNFRLAFFSDMGNLWRTKGEENFNSSDFDITDLRQTIGFGVRFVSPMGPIRLDYGIKMDQREGESKGNFHFAMGSMF